MHLLNHLLENSKLVDCDNNFGVLGFSISQDSGKTHTVCDKCRNQQNLLIVKR